MTDYLSSRLPFQTEFGVTRCHPRSLDSNLISLTSKGWGALVTGMEAQSNRGRSKFTNKKPDSWVQSLEKREL